MYIHTQSGAFARAVGYGSPSRSAALYWGLCGLQR